MAGTHLLLIKMRKHLLLIDQRRKPSTKSNMPLGYRPVNRIANQAKIVQKTTAMNINTKAMKCGIARNHLTSGIHLFKSFLTSGYGISTCTA